MQDVINALSSVVWSPALVALCLTAGIGFSLATRFAQLRHLKEMIRLLQSGKSSGEGVSSFQALTISLSGRVGTGNIAGAAAAIGFGGPGAIFWMWVVAFLGGATAYVESTNAQIYKEKDNEGILHGGPAYYIEKVLNKKWYAWTFALSAIIACAILLPTVQSNSIGSAMENAFGSGLVMDTFFGPVSTMKLMIAILITALLGFIIFGGIKRIAHVTEIIVPFMAIAYLLVAIIIIVTHISMLPSVIMMIISDAFTPEAGYGAAIGWGVKRGIYSNEAGLGNGAHAAAAADVEHPAQQGLVQAFSVYIDTLLVCSATAFLILITQSYNVQVEATGALLIQHIPANVPPNGPAFTQLAIDSQFSGFGEPFVAIALFFFAFTSLLALYFIAEVNAAYINKTLKIKNLQVTVKIIILLACFYGTLKTADIAWGLGDLGIGIVAWLNIFAILAIAITSGPSLKALKDYEQQLRQGKTHYFFDPKKLGIAKAYFWEQKKKSIEKHCEHSQ